MAIEPIGTMTAMQVQNTVKVQPVEKQANSQNTDVVSENSATPKLDDTTAEVAKVSEEGKNYNNQEQKEPDLEQIKKAVENINKKMNTEAVFGIHEETNRVTIKLVDRDTKKTIKELPPEQTIDMIAKVWEMAGILIDEKR